MACVSRGISVSTEADLGFAGRRDVSGFDVHLDVASRRNGVCNKTLSWEVLDLVGLVATLEELLYAMARRWAASCGTWTWKNKCRQWDISQLDQHFRYTQLFSERHRSHRSIPKKTRLVLHTDQQNRCINVVVVGGKIQVVTCVNGGFTANSG